MKLKNKKTGEIGLFENAVDIHDRVVVSTEEGFKYYTSLAELNEDWEDYEEPKENWFIDSGGEVEETTYLTEDDKSNLKNFGNYFETKEEAEKAVVKLKAWKRLKDKGFKFIGWEDTNNDVNDILFEFPYMEWDKNVSGDLDLIFGDEK